MTASSKIPAKHVLRAILRSLRINTAELPTVQQQQQTGSRSTMKYVLEQYRSDQEQRNRSNKTNKAPAPTNTVRDQELRKMAYEYMILRRDIDERSRLHKLDTGAENQLSPHEMSRRAAARAGLALPKLDPDIPE